MSRPLDITQENAGCVQIYFTRVDIYLPIKMVPVVVRTILVKF